MKLRRHLTYANVISTLCLFLVLGGGAAFAATKLAKSSVGTEQLKGEAVTKGKMAPNSVNSKKVVNGSLIGEDINAATLGKVPNATNAEHATSAGSADTAKSATTAGTATDASHATNADSATNAGHANSADTAVDAETLDGHAPGEFGAVVVASPEAELTLEAEAFYSVSGSVNATVLSKATSILPNRRLRATDFAVHFEAASQSSASIHVSLVVNGSAEEVCTLTEVPSTCTPSSTAIEIPAGAQVAWKIASSPGVTARPEFALRLLPS
jgi:hypothetical protein